MNESKRGRMSVGLILIVIGLGFYLINRFEGISEEAILLIIGAAFLVGYFVRKNYALLIPGCILSGLGIGGLGEGSFLAFGEASMLGLGFGFVAIFVIAWLNERKSHWWPLIPGGVLLIMAIPRTQGFFEYLWQHWELILIIIGVLIVLGAFRDKGEIGS
jgi:hypothetical protein